MKKQLLTIATIILLSSCGTKVTEKNSNVTQTTQTNRESPADGKVLCKINGENWSYTEGSGIVFTEKKTQIKKAIFTFKKKLDKGSESVQVEYDIDKQIITRFTIDKDWIDLKGKLSGTLYGELAHNSTYSGNLIKKGSVKVANGLGSGTAQFPSENRYEKQEYAEKYHFADITELSFTDIEYSD